MSNLNAFGHQQQPTLHRLGQMQHGGVMDPKTEVTFSDAETRIDPPSFPIQRIDALEEMTRKLARRVAGAQE